MKKLMCSILATLMMLILPAGIARTAAEEAEDPIVIQVGNYAYPLSLVSFTMRSTADSNGMVWELLSGDEKEVIRDATVNQLIGIGIIENKLAERGKHDFTPAEEEQLRAYAQTQYDSSWSSLYQYLTDNGMTVTEEEVSKWLDRRGYTLDMFYQSALAAERQYLMFELYCGDVSLTDDEVEAYYQEACVEPDREKYEYDISTFETEILNTGSESFFMPEGYRYIRWLTVPYPDEVQAEAEQYALRVTLTDAAVVEAFNNLGLAATQVEDLNDLKPYREAYDQAYAENQAAGEELMEVLRKGLPAGEAARTLTARRLSEGMNFNTAVRLYDSSQLYADADASPSMFHAESTVWSGTVKEVMAALTEPGQLTEPVITADGMVIFYYEGDVPSGAHILTADERTLVRRNAVYNAQLNRLTDLIESWKADYTIRTEIALITLD